MEIKISSSQDSAKSIEYSRNLLKKILSLPPEIKETAYKTVDAMSGSINKNEAN
jgi:hypothetical protein